MDFQLSLEVLESVIDLNLVGDANLMEALLIEEDSQVGEDVLSKETIELAGGSFESELEV